MKRKTSVIRKVLKILMVLDLSFLGIIGYNQLSILKANAIKTGEGVEMMMDQEIHMEGFPPIYIEGNDKIEKERYDLFKEALQTSCNVPGLLKNVTSIHFCSRKVMDEYLKKDLKSENMPKQIAGCANTIVEKNNYSGTVYLCSDRVDLYEKVLLHEFAHIYYNLNSIGNRADVDLTPLKEKQFNVCGFGREACYDSMEETFADAIAKYVLHPDKTSKTLQKWIRNLPQTIDGQHPVEKIFENMQLLMN